MNIFEYGDYKQFFRAWLKAQPKQGHGILRKLALILNVHTTMLTHIFRGNSHLNMEHAVKVTGFLGLDELETDYFINLVQKDRAGDQECRRYFEKQLTQIRGRASKLKNRLGKKNELDEQMRALFYSDWIYSSTHLLQLLPGMDHPRALAETLRIPLSEMRRVLAFLVEAGLSVEKNGRYRMGGTSTFLPADSPYARNFRRTWRLRVLEQSHDLRDEELAFTNPVLISREDFAKVRERIINCIKEFGQIAEPSPSEELACLNIDWVKVR